MGSSFGPDIFGYGLGTPEEEQQDPIGALAQEKAKRQALLEQQRKKFEEENARQRAQAELSSLRGGTSPGVIATPQPTPKPATPEVPGYRNEAVRSSNAANDEVLDRAFQAYKEQQEHPALGFSWGKAPTRDYTPGMDIRSGEFGQAPTQDSSRRAPFSAPSTETYADRQSHGGGGFTDQPAPLTNMSSIEDWQSRVANPAMFSGAMEALDRPGQQAELAKQRAFAKDPFLMETFQARQRMAEKMAPEEAKQEQQQQYYRQAMQIFSARQAALDALHASPRFKALQAADPSKAAAAESDATERFDRAADALDFGVFGRTRSQKVGLLSGS